MIDLTEIFILGDSGTRRRIKASQLNSNPRCDIRHLDIDVDEPLMASPGTRIEHCTLRARRPLLRRLFDILFGRSRRAMIEMRGEVYMNRSEVIMDGAQFDMAIRVR